ncbi:MAG: spore germination protein [Bacillota bacterium]
MFRFIADLIKKKNKETQEVSDSLNSSLALMKLSSSLEKNIGMMKELFRDVDIMRYKTIETAGEPPVRCCAVFSDGLVDSAVVNDSVVKPLMLSPARPVGGLMEYLLESVVQVSETSTADDFQTIVEEVTYGNTVLFVDGCAQAAILNTKGFTLRGIDEPDNERILSGPRDGFNESLMQNIAHIRRRLRTHDLKIKTVKFGRRTQTSASICYLESIVDKDILDEFLKRIKKIDIDGALDTNYIAEQIRDMRFTPFRTTGYTERPDVVVGKLLEGRIALILDGTPAVMTVPYLFIENFQSSEDYYLSFYYTSFSRILRFLAFMLTVMVPGLYIALVAFHHEMIPTPLLLSIASSQRGVPLPASIEAIVMLLVFDVLRETGIRMPTSIGQALSIVGALVIGQAAVEARLVAAPMIIIIAATGITGLLVPRLNAPIIYWRVIMLLLSSSFGLLGLTLGLSALLIHLFNLKSLGVEQISITGRFRFQENKDVLIRAPWWKMITRPDRLTKNKVRQGGGD